MSQIFSIILAIAVAFSGMAGLTANVEETVSFEAGISVGADALLAMSGASGAQVTEETQQTMKVVSDILGAMTLKGVATKDAAELDLLAGADTVLSIGVKNGENGTTIASSLLGDDVIFASAELIEQYRQEMTNAMASQGTGVDMGALETMQDVDKEQIAKDVEEIGEKLTQAIEARKGETEAGEFAVDEMTFTGRTPVNMTYEEFFELLLNATKELTARESVKPLVQMSGKDITAEIDKAIEELKNQEDQPEFSLTAYTDADNCTYYVCDIKKAPAAEGAQEETIRAAFGEVDSLCRCRVNMDTNGQKAEIISTGTKEGTLDMKAVIADANNSTDAEITMKQDEAGNLDLVADIKSPTVAGKIVVKSEAAEDGRSNFSLALYMGDAEQAMITLTGSAGKGGEMASVFEGEALNVIPFEKLTDESDQTTASQLQMKLLVGLMKGMTVISKNVPADTAEWINTKIKQMMSPGSTTTENK